MKNLIKQILQEEFDDLEWIKEIEPTTDLEVGQLWLRSGGINSHNEKFFLKQLPYNDIQYDGDRVFLICENYCEFTELFEDDDSSKYNYINNFLAEKVLCDDDFWEPYYDVIYDWENQVWDLVTEDIEILNHVVEHLKENYVDKVDEKISYDGEKIPFDEKLLNHLIKNNVAQLGFIIYGYDEFDELKRELSWAYESAYNTASMDEIYKSVYEAIHSTFGKGKWESYQVQKLDGVVTRYDLVFDITDLFSDFINQFFSECFDNCRRWFNPKNYEYGGEDNFKDEEEAFEHFCEECWETQQNYFLTEYIEYQKNYGELLNPSFNDYPDEKNLVQHFKEELYGRI